MRDDLDKYFEEQMQNEEFRVAYQSTKLLGEIADALIKNGVDPASETIRRLVDGDDDMDIGTVIRICDMAGIRLEVVPPKKEQSEVQTGEET